MIYAHRALAALFLLFLVACPSVQNWTAEDWEREADLAAADIRNASALVTDLEARDALVKVADHLEGFDFDASAEDTALHAIRAYVEEHLEGDDRQNALAALFLAESFLNRYRAYR